MLVFKFAKKMLKFRKVECGLLDSLGLLDTFTNKIEAEVLSETIRDKEYDILQLKNVLQTVQKLPRL